MKKPVCMFCGAPATLLCDGIIGWDADEDEHGHITKCRAMFTCDAPVCRNCVTWHGNIFFDGKIRMMDTRDLCPLCQKLHEAGESIRVAEHRKNSALPQPGYQRLRWPGNACNWKRITPHERQQSICLHGSLSRWI
ncbi:hypothetical protein F8796_18395 [Salmonella enterica]|nr:hypothetical protein [Salmonella enterica]